ncbi:MAG: STAS/SEC14 domain-containing protein [Acidiferrobacterales bacterium]
MLLAAIGRAFARAFAVIVIEEEKDLLKTTVYAEFTLADYQEFERAVTHELEAVPKIKLFLDLTNMARFTVDVAWEDIKFTRAHAHDFERIAVVTTDQWTSWASWLGTAFTKADVQVFEDPAVANAWLHGKQQH